MRFEIPKAATIYPLLASSSDYAITASSLMLIACKMPDLYEEVDDFRGVLVANWSNEIQFCVE